MNTTDSHTETHEELLCGMDIGGTSVKWIVVTTTGQVIDSSSAPTEVERISSQVVELCQKVVEAHPQVAAIGISTPGIVDEATGTIVFASNLNLSGVHLGEMLAQATAVPVGVGHDGRNAGLAEGILGAGKGASSFIMIPIGTGISAAIYANSAMIAGCEFSAGEIGHTPIMMDGEPCACGQKGCLEVYASAQGIARRYAARTGRDIGTRAIEDALPVDPVAASVWEDAVTTMAASLAHQILTLDPERIIIGGGLSKAGGVYMDPLRDKVASLLAWRQPPPLVTAQLGDMAGRWGAAIQACRALGRNDYERWTA